jgi:hypothetical protein
MSAYFAFLSMHRSRTGEKYTTIVNSQSKFISINLSWVFILIQENYPIIPQPIEWGSIQNLSSYLLHPVSVSLNNIYFSWF